MILPVMSDPDEYTASSARPILIDALNVAYWCGNPPSLRLPLALMAHLIEQGHQAVLYFDASAKYKLANESELYAELVQHSGFVIEVPKGTPADRALLKQANAQDACVLSRDKFRDHRKRYRRLIDDPARRIDGAVVNGRLLIPLLVLDIAVPASVAEAWGQLESLLKSVEKRVQT